MATTTPDPCTPFAERAALMEYLGNMPRAEAERKARLDVETYEARTAASSVRQRELFDR